MTLALIKRLTRIRIRSLLVLIAVVGVFTWLGVRVFPWGRTMWTRSVEMREMADFIASNQRIDLMLASENEEKAERLRQDAAAGDKKALEGVANEVREAEYNRQMARYHAELEQCYRKGAARPWDRLPALPEAPKQK